MQIASVLVQLVELVLRTDNATVVPAVELTNLLADAGDVGTVNLLVLTSAQRCHLIAHGADIGSNLMLQGVVVVTIGERELDTLVDHRGIFDTGTSGHGDVIQQVG